MIMNFGHRGRFRARTRSEEIDRQGLEIRLKRGVLNGRNDCQIGQKPGSSEMILSQEFLRRADSRNQEKEGRKDLIRTCSWMQRAEELKTDRYRKGSEIVLDETSSEKLDTTIDADRSDQISPLLGTPPSLISKTNGTCAHDSKVPPSFMYAQDTSDNITNPSSPISDRDKSENPTVISSSVPWTLDFHNSSFINIIPKSSVRSNKEIEEEYMCSRRPSVGEQGPFALRRYLTSKSESSFIGDTGDTGCMNIPIGNDPSDDEIDGFHDYHDYEADRRTHHDNLCSSNMLDLSTIPSAEEFWTWDEEAQKYYHLDEGSQSPLWYSWES